MINRNRTQQTWEVGNKVNVGFLRDLLVIAKVPTPGDYAPDAYLLMSAKRALYSFVPHNGLVRIDASEAKDMMSRASESLTDKMAI